MDYQVKILTYTSGKSHPLSPVTGDLLLHPFLFLTFLHNHSPKCTMLSISILCFRFSHPIMYDIYGFIRLYCYYLQVVKDRKILEVHVDKGMEDGQKIVFSGEGDQEPGLEPGDIIIVLDEKEHAIFRFVIIFLFIVPLLF